MYIVYKKYKFIHFYNNCYKNHVLYLDNRVKKITEKLNLFKVHWD